VKESSIVKLSVETPYSYREIKTMAYWVKDARTLKKIIDKALKFNVDPGDIIGGLLKINDSNDVL